MDPTASWESLLAALEHGDGAEAREYARALLGWLEQGGFWNVQGVSRGEARDICRLCQDGRGCAAAWQRVVVT